MKITELTIENFRNIANLVLHSMPAGLLVTGMNGAGKSSVIEAIRFALYGRSGHTDRRGAGATRLIQDGQQESHIKLRVTHAGNDVDILCVIGRRASDWSCTEHGTGEVFAENRAGMWARMGIEPDHAEIGAAMGVYLADGFDRVINAYLAEKIETAAVLEHSGSHYEWFSEWLVSHGFRADSYSPDEWREIGASIYGARTGVNKQIKELQYEIESIGFVASPLDTSGETIPVEKLPSVKQRLAAMESARAELLVELGGAGSRRGKESIQNDLVQHSKLLEQAERRVEDLREQVAIAERAKHDAETEMRGLMTEESHLRGRKVELESLARRFKDGVCDKCGSKLTKKQLEQLVGTASDDLEKLGREHAALSQEIERVKLAVKEASDQLNKLRPDFHSAEAERSARAADCAALQREQPAGRTKDQVQADIDDLDEKIAKGREIVTALEKQGNAAGMARALESQKEEAEHMTYFCEALKKGELIARLSQGDKKTQLMARVNAELAPMGYQLDIRPDGKSLAVLLGRGGTLRQLGFCSQGERWLAEFALALGFAGGGPVLLDNLDHLDGVNREHVRKRLREVEGTVLLAMAWNRREAPGTEIARAFEPARLVWVEQGRVVRPGKEVAA